MRTMMMDPSAVRAVNRPAGSLPREGGRAAHDWCGYYGRRDGVAYLSVYRPMVHNPGSDHWLFGDYQHSDDVVDSILNAAHDDDVDAMLIEIDCPGGDTCCMSDLHAAVETYRATGKPIVAYARHHAQSMAYYLAALCDEIWISPSGEVGSVGVMQVFTDSSEYQQSRGLRTVVIATGENKVRVWDGKPIDAETEAAMRGELMAIAQPFYDLVEERRGLAGADLEEVKGGQSFGVADAVRLGLVDRVVSITDAAGLMASLLEDD